MRAGNEFKRYQYYYLVENYREKGQHKQRDLLYLGKRPVLTKAKAQKLLQHLRD